MKVINKNDIHSPGTVILELSQAEYAAISYYAQYFAITAAEVPAVAVAPVADRAAQAAARFPTVNGFNCSNDFQDKLFR